METELCVFVGVGMENRRHIKITDFGFATPIPHGEKTYTVCGTPDYISPEIIQQMGHSFPVRAQLVPQPLLPTAYRLDTNRRRWWRRRRRQAAAAYDWAWLTRF